MLKSTWSLFQDFIQCSNRYDAEHSVAIINIFLPANIQHWDEKHAETSLHNTVDN